MAAVTPRCTLLSRCARYLSERRARCFRVRRVHLRKETLARELAALGGLSELVLAKEDDHERRLSQEWMLCEPVDIE